MATTYLQDELSNGLYTEIYLGGTTPIHKVVTASVTDALATTNSNQQLEINDHETRIGTLETSSGIVPKLLFTPQGTPPPHQEGLIYYDSVKKAHTTYCDVPDVALNIGQEIWKRVFNNTGSAIQNGKPLKQVGVHSGMPSVELAQADSFSNAMVYGISTHLIPAGEVGVITLYGGLGGIDTSGLILGDSIYLSATIAGGFTNVAPDILTVIGSTDLSAVDGEISVRISNNISLPTIYAEMSDGSTTANFTADTYELVSNYANGSNHSMVSDPTAGTITVPISGKYAIVPNIAMSFDTIGNKKEDIFLAIHTDAGATLVKEVRDFLVKDSETASFYPKIWADLVAGKEYTLSIKSSFALQNTAYSLASFDIESKHIR